MSVKSIFRTLIGTIVVIVMSCVIVEMFNSQITSALLSQNIKLSVKQACVLFSQETYRKSSTLLGGAISEIPIYAADGTTYSLYDGGKQMNAFYTGSTAEEVWKHLYIDNPEFKDAMWRLANEINTKILVNYSKKYSSDFETLTARVPELASMYELANNAAVVASSSYPALPSGVRLWELNDDDIRLLTYNMKRRAKTYYETMYTPLNVGIPYMDRETTSKMFKWQLTEILSNGVSGANNGAIVKDENYTGSDDNYKYYVNYRGFAVYTRAAEITGFKFHVCDLNTAAGRSDLEKYTNIKANIGSVGSGLKINVQDPSSVVKNEAISNNLVFVVEVQYRVPVNYIGITPIRNIFNYVFNVTGGNKHRAAGYDGVTGDFGSVAYNDTPTQYIDAGDNGQLVDGTVYYTLVR